MVSIIKIHKSFKEVVYGYIGQFFSLEVQEERNQRITVVEVEAILKEYQAVFRETKHLPSKRSIDHRIPLIPVAKPVNIRPYRSSFLHKEKN